MKQRLFIVGFLLLLAAVLVALNAASYVQRPLDRDTEHAPNRSSFNPGPTGTQALYTLLAETGRKVVRWQDSPGALLTAKSNVPKVFVVAGRLRREFTDRDTDELFRWVSNGGRLVVIERELPETFRTTVAEWKVDLVPNTSMEAYNADGTDQQRLVAKVAAVKPVVPSLFTRSVNAIQPSVLASSIEVNRTILDYSSGTGGLSTRIDDAPPPPKAAPPPKVSTAGQGSGFGSGSASADDEMGDVPAPNVVGPTVHFAANGRDLLVNMPYGAGEIVYLADPYIVSNGGIMLADNAQLAVNLLSAGDSYVAFDEYHQGYGHDSNRFVQFFEGTPVVAIFLQAIVLVGLVFFSQSRRFARPVPEAEPNRLSKLEYVSAMAELQSRTRAYDLAIENIYNDFRRRICRLLGLDNFTAKPNEIAKLIAERTGLDAASVNDDLFACEEIIRGEPTNKREVVRLVESLRSIDETLGTTRAQRSRSTR